MTNPTTKVNWYRAVDQYRAVDHLIRFLREITEGELNLLDNLDEFLEGCRYLILDEKQETSYKDVIENMMLSGTIIKEIKEKLLKVSTHFWDKLWRRESDTHSAPH